MLTYLTGSGNKGSWEPTDLSNLNLWWRADTVVTETGGRVTQWTDLSGNGNHGVATSGSTQRPTVNSNVLNGQPAVSFNGSTPNYLTVGTNNLFATGSGNMVFHVLRFNGFPGVNAYSVIMGFRGSTVNNQYIQTFFNSSTPYREFTLGWWDGVSTVMGGTPSLGSGFNSIYTSYNGSGANTVGNYTLKKNFSPVTLVNTLTPWTGTYINIYGAYTAGIPLALNADVCEVIMTGSVPSAAQQAQLTRYILSRYAI